MVWSDLAARASAVFLATWPQPAQFYPQAGGGPIAITGVIERPALLEDERPGSSAGPTVVRLWVDFQNVSPQPQKGDQLSIASVNYDLFDVIADPDGGGAILKLRRNHA